MFQPNKRTRAALVLIAGFAILATAACSKSRLGSSGDLNPTSSPAESVVATLNSLANDSEATSFSFEDSPVLQSQSAACKASSAKSACNVTNQVAVNWSDCAGANGQTLSGGWINTYSNTRACVVAQTGPLASGDSLTRTSGGMAIKGLYGGTLTWSTILHLTYDYTTIPNTGLVVSRLGNSRSITLNGLRRTLQDANGKTVYDLSIVSQSAVMITGQRNNGSRIINSGNVRVYNNTDKFTSDNSFSNVEWLNAGCAFPTAGTISTSFSGSKNGITMLTFTTTCGQAKLTDTNGSKQTIDLKQTE